MKKIALFDLDRTIYNAHSFLELAEYVIKKGRVKQETWDDIQNLLKEYKLGNATYSDTANKLLVTFAKELDGQKYEDLYSDVYAFFINNKQNFYSYFEKILPTLHRNYDVFIITTNAQYVAQAIVDLFGLEGFIASEFEVVEGVFTGKVTKSLANGKSMVRDLLEKYGKEGSVACGDSENDIGMLELVDHPICINPTDKLREFADKNGWRLVSFEDAEEYFLGLLTQ